MIRCDKCIHKEVCEWVCNFDFDCSDYLEERPKGKWIKLSHLNYECSICQGEALDFNDYAYLSIYCPHCGAKMEGVKNEDIN